MGFGWGGGQLTPILFLLFPLVGSKEAPCQLSASKVAWKLKFYGWKTTTKTRQKQNNSQELEASLALAEAEVGAVAKADQKGSWP